MSCVLLVDDDPEVHALVSRALAARGRKVVGAFSAKEGLSALVNQSVEAAIVDGVLPDQHGSEFIRQLRQTHPKLPILFISAFKTDLGAQRALTEELGVLRIIHKPFVPAELAGWLEELLPVHLGEAAVLQDIPQMPSPDSEMGKAFSVLRERYLSELPARVEEISEALEFTRKEQGPLIDAIRLAHNLRGSSGSYGFVQLRVAAGKLEDLLRSLSSSEGSPSWDEVQRAFQMVKALEPPLEAAPASAGVIGSLLVLDEDRALLEEMERLGNERQVRVRTARTIEDALQVATRHWLDGALIHLNLGGAYGGLALTESLRAQVGMEAFPIGFFAEGGVLKERVEAARAGGAVFLSRPLSAQDLADSAERFVEMRRAERSRVLVVDDDPDFAAHLEAILREEGYDVQSLGDPFHILEVLSVFRPEMVLLDAIMPGLSGFDLCKMLRSMPEWRELPLLIMTARLDDPMRIAAFRAGADDYLSKPILREELQARVRGRLERARLFRIRSERDALTGLLMRRPFLEAASARLAAAKRNNHPTAVGILDVDSFKKINDTFGHLAGDQVLARLGRLLGARLRTEDVRGRWGGEEFGVVLSGASGSNARVVLSRLAADLASFRFESAKSDETFHATLSGGVAYFPADGETLEDLLRAADGRLYQAKNMGKNRILDA